MKHTQNACKSALNIILNCADLPQMFELLMTTRNDLKKHFGNLDTYPIVQRWLFRIFDVSYMLLNKE